MRKRLFPVALTLGGALLLGACASYKPGAAAQGTVESIWVAPAINQSYMPQVATIISERVRNTFLQDNLVRLVRKDAADARLEITVKQVDRTGRATGHGK